MTPLTFLMPAAFATALSVAWGSFAFARLVNRRVIPRLTGKRWTLHRRFPFASAGVILLFSAFYWSYVAGTPYSPHFAFPQWAAQPCRSLGWAYCFEGAQDETLTAFVVYLVLLADVAFVSCFNEEFWSSRPETDAGSSF